MSYYTAKVSLAVDTAKGVKRVTEMYLVDAQSVTHAEAMVVKDFEGDGVYVYIDGEDSFEEDAPDEIKEEKEVDPRWAILNKLKAKD